MDSLFERILKLLHFGIMLGFSIVGPGFYLDDDEIDYSSFQSLALILMASRLLLFVQYGMVFLFTWKFKGVRTPMALKMTSLAIAAGIYLGLYYDFDGSHSFDGHIGFYVTAVVETSVLFLVSNRWAIFGFHQTCLVDRLGGLTLIILGEGVIGLSEALYTISTSKFYDTPTFIGVTIGAVVIIVSSIILVYEFANPDSTSYTYYTSINPRLRRPPLLVNIYGQSFISLCTLVLFLLSKESVRSSFGRLPCRWRMSRLRMQDSVHPLPSHLLKISHHSGTKL